MRMQASQWVLPLCLGSVVLGSAVSTPRLCEWPPVVSLPFTSSPSFDPIATGASREERFEADEFNPQSEPPSNTDTSDTDLMRWLKKSIRIDAGKTTRYAGGREIITYRVTDDDTESFDIEMNMKVIYGDNEPRYRYKIVCHLPISDLAGAKVWVAPVKYGSQALSRAIRGHPKFEERSPRTDLTGVSYDPQALEILPENTEIGENKSRSPYFAYAVILTCQQKTDADEQRKPILVQCSANLQRAGEADSQDNDANVSFVDRDHVGQIMIFFETQETAKRFAAKFKEALNPAHTQSQTDPANGR